MNNYSVKNVLKRNTMIVVMFIVYTFFAIMTKGNIFTASQFTALITQNAYVFVLGTGMLMCMLTGGNIDLSVGSFVCFIGAIAGVVSVLHQVNTPLSLAIVLAVGMHRFMQRTDADGFFCDQICICHSCSFIKMQTAQCFFCPILFIPRE